MKSLREYKLQVEPQTSQSNRITWGGSFPTAIHGTVNGIPCRAIAPGDMPGAFEQLAKISQGEFDAAQDAAKFKSKGWGRAGCWAVGGLILILTCWAMYYELLPAILKGLE